ncbi:hypothetical protein CEXT_5321 [Caerostris extrusa]|uniref:Uncharacterized protein n=1 Tax=Caerostris extrusa TaxID=172846 RepID=A0AAV4S587_CAEEX|nr:hypothetical protein CEXT_5321 [Caerostris extrusa]
MNFERHLMKCSPSQKCWMAFLGRNGINNGYQNVVVRTDRCDKSAGNQAISSLPMHDGAIVNKKGGIWPCSNELSV